MRVKTNGTTSIDLAIGNYNEKKVCLIKQSTGDCLLDYVDALCDLCYSISLPNGEYREFKLPIGIRNLSIAVLLCDVNKLIEVKTEISVLDALVQLWFDEKINNESLDETLNKIDTYCTTHSIYERTPLPGTGILGGICLWISNANRIVAEGFDIPVYEYLWRGITAIDSSLPTDVKSNTYRKFGDEKDWLRWRNSRDNEIRENIYVNLLNSEYAESINCIARMYAVSDSSAFIKMFITAYKGECWE